MTSGPQCVHWVPPLDPMITKMVPQVPNRKLEGLQNDNLRYKKTPISIANQPAAPCIQGGRRQGRSLKIRRTPRRGAAGRDGIATEVLADTRIQGSPPLPPTRPRRPQSKSSKSIAKSDSKKSACELQNGLLLAPRRARNIVKSVRKRRSGALSDPFRK